MPFAFGNDTYWTTQLMTQSLDTLDDVRRGRHAARRTSPTRSTPSSRTAGSRWSTRGASTTTSPRSASRKGQEAFAAGKAAMTIGDRRPDVRQWAKDLGGEQAHGLQVARVRHRRAQGRLQRHAVDVVLRHVVVGAPAGGGRLPDASCTRRTQLERVVRGDRHAAGRRPLRHRRRSTTPLDKKLYAFNTTGQQIWLQNFFPPQIDLNGNAPAQEHAARRAGRRCRGGADPRARRRAVARPAGRTS